MKIGDIYGRLTITDFHSYKDSTDRTRKMVDCICSCGNLKTCRVEALKSDATRSCGCYKRERLLEFTKTHGATGTETYKKWERMKMRCHPTLGKPEYGLRGITFDPSWGKYENFLNDMGECDGLSLERIDVNGNYCKDNCEWIEFSRQALNRRNTIWVNYKDSLMCLSEACRFENINYHLVYNRMTKHNIPFDKALRKDKRLHF